MKTLSKKRAVRRFAMLLTCFAAIAVGVFFAAKQLKTVKTSAVTKDGTNVSISYVTEGTDTSTEYEGWVHLNNSTGWGTPMFSVTLEGETLPRTAYCLNPNTPAPAKSPSGTYNYKVASFPVNDKTKKIKLALYIITAPESDSEAAAIRNGSDWSWNNLENINSNWQSDINPNSAEYAARNYQYIMIHALIGSIYDAGQENVTSIWNNLAESERNWITNITSKLGTLISNNSDVWKRANSHQLLGLDTSNLSGKQNIVWLEPYSISTSATDNEDGDEYVAAKKEAKIVDTVNYCAQEGVNYTIQGTLMDKSTGKALSVDGKNITASANVTPTAECDVATLTFSFDASALAGTDIVAFQSLVASDGTTLMSHEDINDPAQTVAVVSLDTDASGKNDSKEIVASEGATITDHVKYCLAAGTEYTIVGTLMDKSTGDPIAINNEPITQAATVTPTKNCGELDMEFKFDATGMGGTEIVVFEYAGIKVDASHIPENEICVTYDMDNSEEGSVACSTYMRNIVSHEDIDDEAQTILVVDPAKAPETGAVSMDKGSNSTSMNGIIIAVVAISATSIIAYPVVRFTAKKRFLGRK